MMRKKYPESDPLFYQKVRGACKNEWERGLVYILQHTGMHISCLMALTIRQFNFKTGDISWRRTKTDRPMRTRIPIGDRKAVHAWIRDFGRDKRTQRWARMTIAEVGRRAGFEDLSPMTFRTQRAITLLDEGQPPHEVCHLLGVRLDTLMDYYAQLKDDRKADRANQEGDEDA